MRNVIILPDQAAIASRAAQILSESTSTDKDVVSISLSGGTTPKLLHRLLAAEPYRDLLPWSKIDWYFGDERYVPADDPQSNFRMARETLFEPAEVSPEKVFPVMTELPDAEKAAADYERTIRHNVPTSKECVPVFDLILLGMGDDGHTASLFPATAALDEESLAVTANYVEKLSAWRITLTKPVLLAAKKVIVMVAGAEKSAALAAVLQGPANERLYPSQILNERTGDTIWLVDQAAAAQLTIST